MSKLKNAPISPYGYHKLAAENLCKEFNDIYNIQTLIVRIFSAYGPGLKKLLFWDLHQKSLSSDKVELFGTGEETRDFIFIDDLVKALELVMVNSLYENDIINIESVYKSKF
jgi:dTDP-glucose 4,6-dehydratase/UDP-glucose 4-epimerase